jgi:antitoxin ParD1/3/4
MTTVTISLPEKMKEYVESQVESGRYGNVSEYFRALVRSKQEEYDRRLEELLIEGLDSGEGIEVTDEYIQQKRARLISRIEERQRMSG